MKLIFLLLWANLALAQGESPEQWTVLNRTYYIDDLQKSLLGLGAERVEESNAQVDFSARTACRSPVVSLKVVCLQKLMKDSCSSEDNCLRVADLKIVNKVNEKTFISNREKFKLLRKYPDQSNSEVLVSQLLARYGRLAAKFSLTTPSDCRDLLSDCASQNLDSFCRLQNNLGKRTWQSCVSAIVWFAYHAGRQHESN